MGDARTDSASGERFERADEGSPARESAAPTRPARPGLWWEWAAGEAEPARREATSAAWRETTASSAAALVAPVREAAAWRAASVRPAMLAATARTQTV